MGHDLKNIKASSLRDDIKEIDLLEKEIVTSITLGTNSIANVNGLRVR